MIQFLIFVPYLFFPILMTPILILYVCKSNEFRKIYMSMICLNIAIISYHYIPPNNYDLSRHYEYMNYISSMNLNYFFSNELFLNTDILTRIFMYFVSLTGNNQLLTFFVAFIGYYIILYIVWDYSYNNNINVIYSLILSIFVCSIFGYIGFISGIRNGLAFILFSLALYLDFIKNKKGILIYMLYVLPVFVHISTILPFLIRICMNIFYNIRGYIKYAIILMWPIFIRLFVLFLYQLNNFYSIYIARKIDAYTINTINILDMPKPTILELIVVFTIFIIILRNREEKNIEGSKFLKLYILIILPSILYQYVFGRFCLIVYFFGIVFIIEKFSKLKRSKYIFLNYILILTIFGIVVQRTIYGEVSLDIGTVNLLTSNLFVLINR